MWMRLFDICEGAFPACVRIVLTLHKLNSSSLCDDVVDDLYDAPAVLCSFVLFSTIIMGALTLMRSR